MHVCEINLKPKHITMFDTSSLEEYVNERYKQYTDGIQEYDKILITLSTTAIFGIFFVLYRNSSDDFLLVVLCLKIAAITSALVIFLHWLSNIMVQYANKKNYKISNKYLQMMRDDAFYHGDGERYHPKVEHEKMDKWYTLANLVRWGMHGCFLLTLINFIYMIMMYGGEFFL